MRVVIAALLLVGCGSKPTPKPPAPELEITGPASFAGRWVTDDDMDFGYSLAIAADGAYELTIDRGKLGTCTQEGRLARAADTKHYTLPYTKDTCGNAAGVEIAIQSFTGSVLVIAMTSDGTTLHRTYTRDPKSI